MPTILSNLSWIQTSKFPSIEKNNITNFHNNFGVFFHPKIKVPSLKVKVDDVQDQDLSKVNNFGKILDHEFVKVRYVCDDYVVRQNFVVRLYEIDVQQKASLEALLNYTQETSLNMCQSSGLVVEGFGVSEEMSSQNLIWVIGRKQVVVDSYPSWGDIVKVETWCSGLGKHTLISSSRLTDAQTGKLIMRVDSDFVMINEKTRRLSRIPQEIRAKGEPYVRDLHPLPIANKYLNFTKLKKFNPDEAHHVQKGIKPLWFDLDPNQHVNNVKYVNWILEGTPESVREEYELEAIIIEHRRECGRENELKSLSVASNESPNQFHHLLLFEDGTEVARANSFWRPKPIIN